MKETPIRDLFRGWGGKDWLAAAGVVLLLNIILAHLHN